MSSNTFFLKHQRLGQIRGLFMCTYFLLSFCGLNAQTVSDTFDTADIPTNLGTYNSSCNGPLTKISVTLPPGQSWTVTGMDIRYNMTAQAGGLKSHQRSYIRCTNTSTSEDSIYQGTGNTGGIQTYIRNGIDIANGNYAGGTVLQFEMRAWRTSIGTGCSAANNKVDNFTWIITVHYSQIGDEGSVGIGTIVPASSAILDLSSTTQAFLPPRMTTMQRDAISNPIPGMMIFNMTTQQLEIYTQGWGSISFKSKAFNNLFGGSDFEDCHSIQQTSEGGYIVAGNSTSSNSGDLQGIINNGMPDGWIFKLDAKGNITWQKLIGGNSGEEIKKVIQTSDGGYLVVGNSLSSNSGTLTGIINNGNWDVYLTKLNSNGVIEWQKLYGGNATEFGHSVTETQGGYIVAAQSNSVGTGTLTGLTNNGNYDAWILKINFEGNIIWQKLIGGSNSDRAFDVKANLDGGLIVGGSSSSSLTGHLQYTTNNGGLDFLVMYLSSTGNIIWISLLGGLFDDIAYGIELTSTGLIIAGGSLSSNSGTLTGITSNGGQDSYIISLDNSGAINWQKLLGGSNADIAYSLDVTSDGGCIISCQSSSSNSGTLLGQISNGNIDNWIIKLSENGLLQWQRLLGGIGYDIPQSIMQTNDGGYIVAGYSSSSNTGTLTGLTTNGADDFWIYKLDVNGNLY